MTQYPRMHSSPGVFSSASVPVPTFTIWAWDQAASGWGLPPFHFGMGGPQDGGSFAFLPPSNEGPWLCPSPGKGDKGWSRSITSPTLELGMKE